MTFGLGPASHACAIARAIRRLSAAEAIVAVADGIALDYLRGTELFDEVVEVAAGEFPARLRAAATVAVADFDRAGQARATGTRLVVVDPLFWMWHEAPFDPVLADRYLCLEFPGVAERVAALSAARRQRVEVIPQIVDVPQAPPDASSRSGALLNLGGVVAPFGDARQYVRSLVRVVARVAGQHGLALTVACSRAAAAALDGAADGGVRVAQLAPDEMLEALAGAALLVSVPGLSIIWEAVLLRTPTVLVPGLNYSQHRQLVSFQRWIRSLPVFSWADLAGYGLLPEGLAERDGVLKAVELGDRFHGDDRAQQQLAAWLSGQMARPPAPAQLRPGGPWTAFDGADHVARHAFATGAGGRRE